MTATASDEALRSAGLVGARLDRLPATRTIWTRVVLLSFGGFFEFYDLFFTGYVAPGLIRSGILTPTTPGLFGTSGVASFVAALFAGLFVGTALFGFVADRFGRRTIFTVSMLWYTAATVVMAFQTDAFGLNLWRFIAGIGIGVELVTVDTYIAELVPKHVRGRAFAYNQVVQFLAVPTVAFLAWQLVPIAPFGLDGWRWVVLIGSVGALFVWWIRRNVPESPRWLASHGRAAEADAVLSEAACAGGVVSPTPAPINNMPGMTSAGVWTAARFVNHHRPASATSDPAQVCRRAPMDSVSRPPTIDIIIVAAVSASSACPVA